MTEWKIEQSYGDAGGKLTELLKDSEVLATLSCSDDDARLMAAAPDLLAALQDVQKKLQKLAAMESDANSYRYAHTCDCIETCKIAIAKAKGGTNAK
jgi:hypothetical protein